MRDGFLTAETVESLRPRLPDLGKLPDPAHVTPKDLFGLLTVETLCDLVESRLAGPGAWPSPFVPESGLSTST